MPFVAGDVETVTVVRPPARDPRTGDPVAGSAVEAELAGCLFAPGPSDDAGIGANQVQSDATLYAPPGADIRAADRIRVRDGDLYEVIGKPRVWSTVGLEVLLREVTG